MRLLVVEDDKDLAKSLKEKLKKNFIVDLAFDGTDGTYQAQINLYDLIIIDIGLPDMSGVEVCKMTRAANIQIPILMLTGENQTEFKVSSLDSGADDYLTKPFDFAELQARIRALLRRGSKAISTSVINLGDLTFDTKTKEAKVGGRTLNLTRKETNLLELLAHNPNKLLTKEDLLESIWEEGLSIESNALDVHISNLRKKLEKRLGKRIIHTIYGIGYKLEP